MHSDTFVENALVDMYCRNGRPRVARAVFEVMLVKDVVSWRTMVYGYLRCGDVGSACELFEGMPAQRDVIAWTALISGCVQAKEPIRALELFRAMQVEGEAPPNTVTMVGVLSGCADVGALDLGRCVHGWIVRAGMDAEIAVLNALIDMYAKSGSVGTARLIFDGMERKDAYTWTTMISASAIHGDGVGSVSKFSKMVESGEMPNEVTFLALLSACTHGGLVEEGRKYFTMMREVYKLEPRIEHYGCMVDLLGRAGCLQESEELMSGMGMEPDGVMLRSLMSSSLLHGDLDLAVKTGREIIRRQPEDDGVHILLFNIFASGNRWQEALEVRNRMKDCRIKKKPGCSWIEVNGVVHEFLVENGNHFLLEEIKTLLQGIRKQF